MSQPKIVQKSPFIKQVEPGKYAWCACGLSENQPYCDGSHKVTDIRPVIVDITEKRKSPSADASIPEINHFVMEHI
jgi:CDGSH-type Zn-finger protein